MKSNFKFLIIIAAFLMIGLLFLACEEKKDTGPGGLHGKWYSSEWKEYFEFDVDTLIYSKIQDAGWGERGSFTFTSSEFITHVEQILDGAGEQWRPASEAAGEIKTETRPYTISGDVLIIWGENFYKKVK